MQEDAEAGEDVWERDQENSDDLEDDDMLWMT